jgi:hypothetical protein
MDEAVTIATTHWRECRRLACRHTEFVFGLDLILDGLDRLRDA